MTPEPAQLVDSRVLQNVHDPPRKSLMLVYLYIHAEREKTLDHLLPELFSLSFLYISGKKNKPPKCVIIPTLLILIPVMSVVSCGIY